MQQALERAGIKSNKGWDYGMNALEMASLMKNLKGGDRTLNAGVPSAIGAAAFNS